MKRRVILQLSKETIRELGSHGLQQVQGGDDSDKTACVDRRTHAYSCAPCYAVE